MTKEFEASMAGSTAGSRAAASDEKDRSRRLENLGERADRMTDEAARSAESLKDRAAEAVDSAKDKVSETYDRTRDALNRSYDRAIDYGRQNPGSAILMGFGAGVGVGLLLAGGAVGRRRSRLLPAVATSLADIVYEVFDRR